MNDCGPRHDPGDDPASIEFRIHLGTVWQYKKKKISNLHGCPFQIDQNDQQEINDN